MPYTLDSTELNNAQIIIIFFYPALLSLRDNRVEINGPIITSGISNLS